VKVKQWNLLTSALISRASAYSTWERRVWRSSRLDPRV